MKQQSPAELQVTGTGYLKRAKDQLTWRNQSTKPRSAEQRWTESEARQGRVRRNCIEIHRAEAEAEAEAAIGSVSDACRIWNPFRDSVQVVSQGKK
jgi:hypothetical protein